MNPNAPICPGLIKDPTKAEPSFLTASAPEAVWPDVVELQEVLVKQRPTPGVPGGPETVIRAEPLGPEVVVALELLAQLPELPVTPDWIFKFCVLDELLQVYAFAGDVGVI